MKMTSDFDQLFELVTGVLVSDLRLVQTRKVTDRVFRARQFYCYACRKWTGDFNPRLIGDRIGVGRTTVRQSSLRVRAAIRAYDPDPFADNGSLPKCWVDWAKRFKVLVR